MGAGGPRARQSLLGAAPQVQLLGAAQGTCEGDTGTTGATGAASGPLGLLIVAVFAMLEPGDTLATMTSNTTVTEPLAGTLMFDTVTMPLSLSPLGAGENALLDPAGMATNPPKLTFAGM